MEQITKKKRGRKPKGKVLNTSIQKSNENLIITHLPINLIDSTDIDTIKDNESISGLFIKDNNKDELIEKLEKENKQLKQKLKLCSNKKDNLYVYQIEYTDGIPCWWCRHNFKTPKVELPIKYFNEQFYTFGNFCSYECCEAYNIDLNDENVSKRSSLLNYHYYKTYNEFKKINRAPNWKILKGYGGCIDIDTFRNNFTVNEEDYNYLKPPMVSRYAHIEKINLISNSSIVKKDELVLKRTKPLKNKKYSLKNFITTNNED
jgi:hypothetical protein